MYHPCIPSETRIWIILAYYDIQKYANNNQPRNTAYLFSFVFIFQPYKCRRIIRCQEDTNSVLRLSLMVCWEWCLHSMRCISSMRSMCVWVCVRLGGLVHGKYNRTAQHYIIKSLALFGWCKQKPLIHIPYCLLCMLSSYSPNILVNFAFNFITQQPTYIFIFGQCVYANFLFSRLF